MTCLDLRPYAYLLCKLAISLAAVALCTLLVGCPGQSYSCGTADANHCYGIVTWSDNVTGLSMELTAVDLTSGNIFIDDETWLIDYFASGDPNSGAYWVEAGETNDGLGTEYFFAENKTYWGFQSYDLGAVAPSDIHAGNWIAFKIEQDSKDTTQWNVTISRAKDGTVLFTGQSTENPMTPNTVIEGQELAGSSGAQAPLAVFSDNRVVKAGKSKVQTNDGTVRRDNPPNADWFPGNNKPSQTSNGGLFFTDCCG